MLPSVLGLAVISTSCQNLPTRSTPNGGTQSIIARIWRGVTRESDKDTYFEYLQQTGLKEYASIPSNQGVWVLRRVSGGQAEFTLLSLWESWDAIKAFAGAD